MRAADCRKWIPFVILLVAGNAILAATPSVQGASRLKVEFDRLKSLEGRIPLPTPSATLRVGPFAAGESRSRALPRDRMEDPRLVNRDFRLAADAVTVILQFSTDQRTGPFTVTVDGKRHSTSATGTTISVNVGRAARMSYSVTSGTTTYKGSISITRPPIIGAGVFTIKALPVALIYAPPQTHPDKPNVVTYRSITSVGTTTGFTFSEDSATTRPETPSQFADVGTAQGILNAASSAAKLIPKAGSAISSALSAFSSGLGSASASSTAGKATVRNNQLTLEQAIGNTFSSTVGLGPGDGDRIVFLRNARLMWVVDGSGVHLAFIGADNQAVEGIGLLRKAAAGQLPAADMAALPDIATIQDLLKLDPFVASGSRPVLPPDRFVYVDSYTGSGTGPEGDEYLFEYRLSAADSFAKTSYSIRTEDFRSGFLSFLGLGVTESKSTKTTISHTSMAATTNSASIATNGRFHAAPNQRYAVEAYYDRAFGTFCFVDAATSAPSTSGVLKDPSGSPVANQIVTITAGQKRVSTRTDSQGRYAFFSPQIKAGNFVLQSGAIKRSLTIQGGSPSTTKP